MYDFNNKDLKKDFTQLETFSGVEQIEYTIISIKQKIIRV